jgi:hypothetical protein
VEPRYWYCPNCDAEARTVDTALPMHKCKGIVGLLAPLILRGTNAKVTVNDREDYLGRDLPQTNAEGKIVMSTTTVRDDGQDCTIYVPTAQLNVE